MSYQYDLSDFKRYLNDKSPKYRVDGLIFWQNRIPLPIDLFNRIFNESDLIVTDYVYQIVASAVTFSHQDSFKQTFNIAVTDLPKSDLKKQVIALQDWLESYLIDNSSITRMAYEIADTLGIEDFKFSTHKVTNALQHQGKKYARIFMPSSIRKELDRISYCEGIGKDNTDMFGNIIADRYNIYRSGFSDALAIIFNALLDFRILCSGRREHLQKIRIPEPIIANADVRVGKTSDGSLWEPSYEDDHYVTINAEHPFLRNLSQEQSKPLAEALFTLGVFENNQFSDTNRKFLENMRQTISRSLWIKHD
jgi:hypothetical protein